MKLTETREHGDVSLCNLASINLVEYLKSDEERKQEIVKWAVRGLNYAISNGSCPVPEGDITNWKYRYMGIGVLNMAHAMAIDQVYIDSQEGKEWIDRVFDDLSYRLYFESMVLASDVGEFEGFGETEWAKGLTPVHKSKEHFPAVWEITEYGKNFNFDRWDELGKLIKKNGIANAQVMSIAPTANSGKAINATESTEPIMGFMYKEEGVANVPTIVPGFKQNNRFYTTAFECNQMALVENAAIRQKYIDQAQSITLYFKDVSSLKELTTIHNRGFELGVKTFYYVKQQKSNQVDECTACVA